MLRPFVLLTAAAVSVGLNRVWALSDSGSWDYKNIEHWGGLCERGIMQSPVDIESDDVETDFAEPLILFNYDRAEAATFKSGPKHIEVKVPGSCMVAMAGGGLRSLYVLHHIHFHLESEHTIDGQRMPMEAHFVHYNNEYGNLSAAATHPRGLAVLAVLFHKHDVQPSNIYFLLNGLQQQLTTTPTLAPLRFVPTNREMFYRYEGSLTTPPCSEVVVWTILKHTLPVSPKQIKELKGFLGGGTVNYRPVQDINGRVVKLLSTTASSHKISPSITVFLLPLLFSLRILS